jgi:hypothetical protein
LVLILAGCGLGLVVVLQQGKVTPESIANSVSRDPELMERAWRLPAASTYKRELNWQSNPSTCGPASAANVLASLDGIVRNESAVLNGTGLCWTGYCILGLSLDELADVVRQITKRTVTVLRDLSEDEFRNHMRMANSAGRRYIINFSRAPIFGAGVGHHSPVGGYLENEDLVLVLDVNPDFKPWLVERTRLYDAMNTFADDQKRGLLLIE